MAAKKMFKEAVMVLENTMAAEAARFEKSFGSLSDLERHRVKALAAERWQVLLRTPPWLRALG